MSFNKYRVAPKANRTADGVTFDSKAEMERYLELKLMLKGKLISRLELQPEFELQPGFEFGGKKYRPIKYIADFSYLENGSWVYEDVKGVKTKEFILKHKMVLYKYGIDLRIIK